MDGQIIFCLFVSLCPCLCLYVCLCTCLLAVWLNGYGIVHINKVTVLMKLT